MGTLLVSAKVEPNVGAAFSFGPPAGLQLITTAIHAGHELRPEIARRMSLDSDTRRREEDPFTDRVTAAGGTRVVVHRSRFEVDLNRPRDLAVYTTPESAWGLDIWLTPLLPAEIARSLAVYDDFYARLALVLDGIGDRGPFVVFDVHSYNHRRGGPGVAPALALDNPEINVGTALLDRARWGGLIERFVGDLGSRKVGLHRLDVRENVRFEGGQMSRWVHERYGAVGCVLALEFKKLFMDEWSGVPDDDHLRQLTAALAATVPNVLKGLR